MAKRDDAKTKKDKTKKTARAKKPDAAKQAAGAGDDKPDGDTDGPGDQPKFRSPMQQINANDLKNLLRRTLALQKQASETSGTAGEMVKNAVEKKNLDRRAFAMIKALVRMSDDKRATTLACFDYYREQCADELGETEDTQDQQFGFARQEAGEKEDGAPGQIPKGSTKKTEKPDGERDLRPAHMRDGRDEKTSQSATVTELKRNAGIH